MGASGSGKSILLKALCGRVQSLYVSGSVYLDGIDIDPTSVHNSVSYVDQENTLIGDMTAREMISTSARLKRDLPSKEIGDNVDIVLKQLGLDHVADTQIGTIWKAGLSGGQKRRVDVGIELVAPPSILLLDEPTSGLDGSTAYEVLHAIRETVLNSQNKLSIILNIHQPNSRILELFDHILVLGKGNMTFFGTVPESIAHFTDINLPPPARYTPTDFYLQVTDVNFSDEKTFDFEGTFASSKLYISLMDVLDKVGKTGLATRLSQELGAVGNVDPRAISPIKTEVLRDLEAIEQGEVATKSMGTTYQSSGIFRRETSFLQQYLTLLNRELVVARRDITLYYLQFVLVTIFGLLVGSVFYNLDYKIDSSMYYVPGGLLWLSMMMIYIQVFKVYHIRKSHIRFDHEHANKSYSIIAYWLAETSISALGLVFYIPGVAIGYFMMGLPAKPFAFLVLLYWTVSCLPLLIISIYRCYLIKI